VLNRSIPELYPPSGRSSSAPRGFEKVGALAGIDDIAGALLFDEGASQSRKYLPEDQNRLDIAL